MLEDIQQHGDIKIGDLITCYHSGVHKVDRIVNRYATSTDVQQRARWQSPIAEGALLSTIVHMTKVLSESGAKVNRKMKFNTHVSNCRPFDEFIQKVANQLDRLVAYRNQHEQHRQVGEV